MLACMLLTNQDEGRGGSLMSSGVTSLSYTRVCTHVCVYYQAKADGASPAFIAAAKGHEETVRVLAELNANLNQVTRRVTNNRPMIDRICTSNTSKYHCILLHLTDKY